MHPSTAGIISAATMSQATTTGILKPDWGRDVLGFWFEELQAEDWFKKSDAIDNRIADRFLSTYSAVQQAPIDMLGNSGHEALAAVIVLDQFSRNLFRNHWLAFACDGKARAIANGVIESGSDQAMSLHERVFLYLPFEHSEDIADQHRSVALISALGDESYTKYAIAHRDVIERFGRFPHRNAALQRANTPEETDYLSQPGSGF